MPTTKRPDSAPEPLGWVVRLQDLLNEQDTFKLSIRGHSAIEDLLDSGIAEAFGGSVPKELARLHFAARIALAIALGIHIEPLRNALLANAKVRHDFAHGRIHDLSAVRAAALVRELPAEAPDLGSWPGDKEPPPRIIQAMVIGVLYALIQNAIEIARSRQMQAQRALKLDEGIRGLLAGLDKPPST
jgi:hypothetical protein